ncbi:uroporphyrinogen-III C-methyltransferase [Legionella fairfieldensis]|uniref:uroporphyrinogen-III C-methyltransferase n=1 Tax=Legionella fairfieldensis TaxID=45064 RepID=UPI0004919D8D|nr:uroporphyrinogen-III C-methyltransferase [Legionella fairfieldensis]
MANSNDEQSNSTTVTKDTAVKNPAPVSATDILKPWASCLALLFAIIALLVTLYNFYTNSQSRQFNLQQTQSSRDALDSLEQQQLTIKNSLSNALETFNQTQSVTQKQIQVLDKNLQTALQQRFYQKQDWLLVKARYYLELAQIQAHWSDDQQTTIALLQQADSLLATATDQHLFTVRQTIAKEIAQLQTLPKIDVTGLLSQLDALQHALLELPIKQPFIQSNKENKIANATVSSWREKLQNSMNKLENLVVIRRNDKAIEPLLSPAHQTLLQDRISLNLQEAQWAILQNNSAIYQLALNQALENITRAFDEKASATQAVIQQLKTLQQTKLPTSKPVIGESLSLLNQWIESHRVQPVDAPTTTEGDKSS